MGSARIAVGLIGASFATLAVLQTISLPTQNPLNGTVSAMVHARGGVWLFPAMGALCVAGSVILAIRLARVGARAAALAVALWSVALAAAAAFPTDPPGTAAVSLAAEIHRDAAAVMFVSMPLAGLLVAIFRFGRGQQVLVRQRKLRRAAITSALIAVAQIPVSIPSLFPGSAVASWPAVEGLNQVRGLAERALFVALIIVVARIGEVVILVGEISRNLVAQKDYREWPCTWNMSPPGSPRENPTPELIRHSHPITSKAHRVPVTPDILASHVSRSASRRSASVTYAAS